MITFAHVITLPEDYDCQGTLRFEISSAIAQLPMAGAQLLACTRAGEGVRSEGRLGR